MAHSENIQKQSFRDIIGTLAQILRVCFRELGIRRPMLYECYSLVCVCVSGDVGVSQEESAESSARSVCGHPEALQLRGSAPHPGPAAITQHALPLPRQEPTARLTVRLENT